MLNGQNIAMFFRNQLPLEPITISLSSQEGAIVEISNLLATVQRVDVARHYLGKSAGTSHKGGVTFDLLSRDYVLGNN